MMEEIVRHRINACGEDIYDCDECGKSFTATPIEEYDCYCQAEDHKGFCGWGCVDGKLEGPIDGNISFCVFCGTDRIRFNIGDEATVKKVDSPHYMQSGKVTGLVNQNRLYMIEVAGGSAYYKQDDLQYEGD